MSHSEVYKWFELYFPQYAGDKVESWFQNGKNRIVVTELPYMVNKARLIEKIGGLRLLKAS